MPAWIPLTVLFWSSVLWGLAWWPLKHLSAQGLSGIPLIFIAYGSVGLFLLPLLYGQRRLWLPHWKLLLLVLCCGGIANIAFPASMIYGDVIRSMLLFYLLPVWGVLGARIFLGERLSPSRLLGRGYGAHRRAAFIGRPGHSVGSTFMGGWHRHSVRFCVCQDQSFFSRHAATPCGQQSGFRISGLPVFFPRSCCWQACRNFRAS